MSDSPTPVPPPTVPLGAFSVSLTVSDLAASTRFYTALGFEPIGGDAEHGWLILRHEDAVLGLFQGMFDRNILTFTPGWGADGPTGAPFTDIRDIQQVLRDRGLTLADDTDPAGTGPASITLIDPDGNPVLIDQHLERP
ncbi:hypothetical protein GCM10009808_00550 [Microbacterium sediminicola]|uniref:Glyoxalase/fosfomycin resistance/dioxygenase domain-containing protein n=1 Tax=Microbacterium sediminicola TaxID=415210 RepID=A0ABN2HG80_9MICO